MILETVSVGPMQANCYIIAKDRNASAIIIDPGADEKKIRQVLDKHKLQPVFIVNTHGHYDHIGCDDKFSLPVYIHKEDLRFLKDPQLNLSGLFFMPYRLESEIRILDDGQLIKLDDIELEVLHIPGHTPGGISLLMRKPKKNILFCGDVLFYHSIGRSDFEYGSESQLINSIKEKLLILPDDTLVYPGHGPSTTIREEKENNPFLSGDR